MYRGCWHIVLAIGLIVLPCLGQAQEEAQGEQGQTATQQQPAQTLPIPLLVDIIEDEAEAEARKNREAEARRNQKDDLVAQQGMNAATQAMNRATQRMAKYAFWSTWIVAFGTFLLAATLYQTRRAAISAKDMVDEAKRTTDAANQTISDTREMSERELRAYVNFPLIKTITNTRAPRKMP